MEWLQTHWIQVVAALWSVDQLLKIVAGLTGIKMIDNLADGLGNILNRFFPKSQ